MFNTVIIEDEKAVLDSIVRTFQRVSPQSQIVATLGSVRESLDFFAQPHDVNLILSDVQLTDGLSFRIFSEAGVRVPVIFITAYDQFMMNAFEHNGIDYLLKPVSAADLEKAIAKYQMLQSHFTQPSLPEVFLNSFAQKKRSRIVVQKGSEHISLKLSETVLFYTQNKLVFVVDQQGRKYIADKTLSELESELDPDQFFRVNRQYIVNIDFIRGYRSYEKVKIRVDLALQEAEHFIVVSQETAPLFRRWISEA